jgi:D-3-phosphoglycerate dehydrogenase
MRDILLLLETCDPESWDMLQKQQLEILTPDVKDIDRVGVNHIFTKLNFRLDKFLLGQYPNLKTVVTPTTSIDHIDSSYCEERDIQIISLRDTKDILENFSSTSEIAAWLMLSLSRNALPASADVRAGNWSRNDFIGNTLRGKTVGIVGYGRLGRQLSKICSALGMTIFAYDLLEISDDSVTFTKSLEELVGQSDFVSLHVDDREQNRGLIDAQLLNHFSPNAILINTSRGFVVNEIDLVSAIRGNRLKGYGTDVLEGERGDTSEWLTSSEIWKECRGGNPGVLVLPHIGGAVKENIPTAEKAVLQLLLERIR